MLDNYEAFMKYLHEHYKEWYAAINENGFKVYQSPGNVHGITNVALMPIYGVEGAELNVEEAMKFQSIIDKYNKSQTGRL